MKTGKRSTRVLPIELLRRLDEQSGILYAFQGRDDYRKHRTRQAVYIDIKKAAAKFNIKLNLTPHSLRKNYAVYLKNEGYSIEQIQKLLNHTDITTTLIYVLSDELNVKYRKKTARC
jgi:site-specific recombinase XerD